MRWPLTETRIAPRPGIVSRVVDRSTVLLDTSSGRYFSLDAIGTQAWTHLTSTSSVQAALDALVAEFDADVDLVRKDLVTLIERLEERGLVELTRADA
ncbi:MAG TPA: PqqD family protein [Vicinamibacterales bacterium]|nr:PqqD family protein [Vicinamibacterales bacterium]